MLYDKIARHAYTKILLIIYYVYMLPTLMLTLETLHNLNGSVIATVIHNQIFDVGECLAEC